MLSATVGTFGVMTATDSTTNSGVGTIALSAVAIDCPDPLTLARFYSELTGWPIEDEPHRDWVALVSPHPVSIDFQRVDDYVAPAWPSTDPPQQLHLDFEVADLDAGEERVLAIGATKAEVQPGTTFRVFLDPVGHPFCLCAAD